ncbi:bifunctional riboflavin kinase/FAD synthetase [Methyloradius palustris]|uniref:Riboflavin biosynthesis protein n=1 Tax=Methyloradius palustris TaxID=2778876 RepID=A0A8D5G4I2_9PROT|nr:bifunctional riboflavin kinase/FAD synthetase [Methyloradius palustris]BCM25823.1 riboflavin biosynthesis protein [Methyloradius palustris]
MQVHRHFPEDISGPAKIAPSALAIGNFDGVHLGHQALLAKLVHTAHEQNLKSVVMTFEPHPREFFTPEQAPARLTSLREKLEFFADAGVEQIYICRFNQRFSAITAESFMQDILKTALNAKAILVGDDFRFGAKRHGGIVDLRDAGFHIISVPEVKFCDVRISSTGIRDALKVGALLQAKSFLGRNYSISGKVVHGAKRGRQLGFPTANVHMRHERPALTGVYAVKLTDAALNVHAGVANMGVRPTVAGIPKLSLEVHLFDFDADLYGQHVHVSFLHKIRDEKKFPDFEALKAQISLDARVARDFHNSVIAA